MKLPKIETGSVQSLGRANLGAVSGLASATAGAANAESQLFNTIGGVALDEKARQDKKAEAELQQGLRVAEEFKKREDDFEFNSAVTTTAIEIDDFIEKNKGKDVYTAEEVDGIPEDAVNRTTKGTTDKGDEVEISRKDIPNYKVYPYLLKNKLEGVIRQNAEGITNPQMRQQYMDSANVAASKMLLTATLASEKKQKKYMKDVAKDDSTQLAINGRLTASISAIKAGGFNPAEEKILIRDRQQTYEWSKDDAILNSGTTQAIAARYEQLKSKNYGKGGNDYYGSGSASGKYNQESAKKRFKTGLATSRSKTNNAEKIRIQEEIEHRSVGGDGGLTFSKDFEKSIRDNPSLTINEKNTLVEKAKVADFSGYAATVTVNTSREEDRQLLEKQRKAIKDAPANMKYEMTAAYEISEKVIAEKNRRLLADATGFLIENDDVIAGMAKELESKEVLSNPALFRQKVDVYHATLRANQKERGLLDEEINFITRQDVELFKQATAEIGRDPNAVVGLMSQMDQLKKLAGSEWPAYYSQLIRQDAIKPEHVMASVIKDPSMRIAYINAVGNQELIEKSPHYKSNIGDVREAVFNSMLPLRGTLLTPGALPNVKEGMSINGQLDAFENGLTQMVMSQVAITGKWDADSIKATTQAIIDANWKIYGQVRVPIERKNVNGQMVDKYDYEAIENGLSKFDAFKAFVKISPNLRFASANGNEISFDDDQNILKDNFETFGSAATNSDQTGISFKYSSGNPVMVIRDGRTVPLTIKFEQIEKWGQRVFSSQEELRANRYMVIE